MNKLILFPLIILMFVGAYYMVLNAQPNIVFSYQSSATYTASGQQIKDNVTSTITQGGSYQIYNISVATGLTILITALVIVGVLAGIKVLGSGLSNYSVMLIHKSVVYWSLWAMFSTFSIGAFLSIPIFGAFIWFAFTLLYAVGFFQTLSSGGDED